MNDEATATSFDWIAQAACRLKSRKLNHAMFEPIHREMTQLEQHAANIYCANCPVRQRCYDWVVGTTPDPLPHAFAAGYTSRQRQRLRHEQINNPLTCQCRRCRYYRKKRGEG